MAFGGFSGGTVNQPVAQINMIPLIDVMLVLLVIFMVTAPLLTHAVKVDLPQASSALNETRPENVQLSIDGEGRVFWNGEPVDEAAWRVRMQAAARLDPQPEVHLHADGDLAYRRVVAVMSDASRAGLTRIAFVTDPRQAPGQAQLQAPTQAKTQAQSRP
jgi:biopolymer transport protein ExbD